MTSRRIVAIISFLALALTLGLTMFTGGKTRAMAICSVPSDHPTIQNAVNDANCSTINVAANTYAENVSIPRPLTLNGPNAGTPGAGARVAEAIVSSMSVTSSNVTIDGFTFNNIGSQVNVNGTATTILSGVVVKNNIFTGYQSVGLPTYNAGNLTVTGNLFQNPAAGDLTEAMQVKANNTPGGGCSGTVVSKNVFQGATNNEGADINFSCTGSDSTGVTVADNTDTGLGSAQGPSFTAFSGVIGGISIQNNHVTGTPTAGSAIFFFGGVSGSVDITDNVITGFGGNGIDVHFFLDGLNTGNFTFTHNDLSKNFRSVRLRDGFGVGATVTFHKNNLSGNSTTIGAQNDSTSLVADGACNWWGSASGPNAPTNPSGTGDKAVGAISFSPWLIDANLNGACVGGHVVANKDQCKNGGWQNFVRANNTPFKNQGDCVSYMSNGK